MAAIGWTHSTGQISQNAPMAALGPVADGATYELLDLEAAAHAGGNALPCMGDSPVCKSLLPTHFHQANTDVCALNKAFATSIFRGI